MKFIDKAGRDIMLEESFDIIRAFHNGNCVAEFLFHVFEFDSKHTKPENAAVVDIANVKADYQKCGIGTAIIEFAKDIYDNVSFQADSGIGGNTDQIHYSSEGLALKQYCESKGITVAQEI